MITATSPLFTVFYGRLFIKEAILPIDIFNVVLVFIGMMCIVKPPFLFGTVDELYSNDPEAIYAVIAITLGSIFLQPTVYVILRILKGIHHLHNCLTLLSHLRSFFPSKNLGKLKMVQNWFKHMTEYVEIFASSSRNARVIKSLIMMEWEN